MNLCFFVLQKQYQALKNAIQPTRLSSTEQVAVVLSTTALMNNVVTCKVQRNVIQAS
ncbi:hypothetical protein DPMN_123073 [Dreissena polymorpha]|uniref:Uncharacterized protein n=1 Tax=Dreissena polymorpha TaxID=45954 RepID=A0A9D4GTM1_DREPO|nr:hypothetical protein DPMN_123073 [Dreissena polymorpha]